MAGKKNDDTRMAYVHKRWRKTRFFCLIATLFLFGTILGHPWIENLHAANLGEYDLKAAFVYNFSLFIEWPPDTFTTLDDPINVLVVGGAEIKAPFLKISGKKCGQRALNIIFFNPKKNTMGNRAFQNVHILFFSKASPMPLYKSLMAQLTDQPTLTIGERNDFISNGGMVNFFKKNNRLLFEIQHDRVKNHHIRLSSRLLKLAIIVTD